MSPKALQEMFLNRFPELFEAGIIRKDESLALHTSFKIGGPADLFARPDTERRLIDILLFTLEQSAPYLVIGRGSNLLISDSGFRGIVISTESLKKLSRDEHCISAYAGVELKTLCSYALEAGLSGLEFASGIPGSVGGAVFMNAGAYGGEIKDVLYSSRCLPSSKILLSQKNPILFLKNKDHKFGYRHSALQTEGMFHLSSVFKLSFEDPTVIKAKMDDLEAQRTSKQPMDLPSGGSVFKRPEGHFTGKLIDDCGLRGYRIGDAAISEKHCGFIVNLGNASFKDVMSLIQYAQTTVFERFGVSLQTELRIIGE